jgi:hypothetical protein
MHSYATEYSNLIVPFLSLFLTLFLNWQKNMPTKILALVSIFYRIAVKKQ